MPTTNAMGRLVILGGAAMVAAAPAVPSKALRGGAEAEASMQGLTGQGPIKNDEMNREQQWRSWLSGKDATDGSASSDGVCSNGFPGVQLHNVCCVLECGTCGGSGCDSAGGADLDGDDCCESNIKAANWLCHETGEAPCVIIVPGGSTDPDDSVVFEYAGCFEAQVDSPFDYVTADDAMTPEICEDICSDRSATFYGLREGDTCACGDDATLLVFANGQTEGVCGEPCDGDPSESCGGLTAYDIFLGEDVDFSDDGVVGDDPVYVGCYEVVASNPFYELTTDEAMTVELCYSQCASEDALYFGLLEGIMCGCGNTDGFLSSEQEFGTCDLSCGGSESETCGGALAYALYQIEGIALIPSDSGEDTTCADGTIGIQMADSCCVAECGECGGVGCSTRVPGLGAFDCCATEIADAGVLCSDSGVAPCVVEATDGASTDDSGDDDGGELATYGDYVNYEYKGCFKIVDTFGFEHRVTELEMTHEFCFRKCALDFALYMAITDGIVCKCGVDPDFLGADKEEGSCDVPCPGDGSTMCGAPDSYELFGLIVSSGSPALDADDDGSDVEGDDGSDVPDVTDDDSGAVNDDTVDDDDIETNGADSVDNEVVGPYGDYIDFEYVGCFMATNTFGFRHRVTELDMTHEFCFRKCALNYASYMAITEGNVCKCGVDEDFVDADKVEGSCDIECPGDTTTTCGDYDGSYELFTLVISSDP